MPFQTQKNQAYDNAVTLARYPVTLARSAAGSGGTFGQYYARGNEILWDVGASQITAGTSTYTTTTTTLSGGALTTAVNTNTAATLITGYRVSGTSTTTFQPYVVANVNSTNGTMSLNGFTNAANVNAGGGVLLSAGDFLYQINGTDATAVTQPLYTMSIAPLANVTQ
jgi:hypothetical protein